jgi:hypothetical protein
MNPGPIDSTVLPPENNSATGLLVRLGCILGGTYKCQERFFFFGRDSEKEAEDCYSALLESAHAGELDNGIYHLSLHEAHRGNEVEPNDWEPSELRAVTFSIARAVSVKVIKES